MYVLTSCRYSESTIELTREKCLKAAEEIRELHVDLLKTRVSLAAEEASSKLRVAALDTREKALGQKLKDANENDEAARKWKESGDNTLGLLRQRYISVSLQKVIRSLS